MNTLSQCMAVLWHTLPWQWHLHIQGKAAAAGIPGKTTQSPCKGACRHCPPSLSCLMLQLLLDEMQELLESYIFFRFFLLLQ